MLDCFCMECKLGGSQNKVWLIVGITHCLLKRVELDFTEWTFKDGNSFSFIYYVKCNKIIVVTM